MAKEYQVRVGDEGEVFSDIECFSVLREARKAYTKMVEHVRRERPDDDVHIELVEVIEQECIEPIVEDD